MIEKLQGLAPEGKTAGTYFDILNQYLGKYMGQAVGGNPTLQTPLLDQPPGQRVPGWEQQASAGDTFILNINTQAPYEPILQGFELLQARARQRAA